MTHRGRLIALAGAALVLAANITAAQTPQRGGVARLAVIGNPTANLFTTEQISEFLKRMMMGKAISRVNVTVNGADFSYGFD